MASGYAVTGRGDLDVLFKARTGAPGANTGYLVNGVDLAQRYEQIGATTPIAATGFKVGGVDINSRFMSFGAVSNVVLLPNVEASAETVIPGATAVARYNVLNTGFVDHTNGGNAVVSAGAWITPQTNMSLYSIKADQQPGGSGTIGGESLGVWLNLGSTRGWNLAQPGSGVFQRTLKFTVRLDSSGLEVNTVNINFTAAREPI